MVARGKAWQHRPAAAAIAAAVVGSVGVVVGEVVWVAHRRLPTIEGLDASGVVPGGAETAPIRLVVLGDSTLTGPGLGGPEEIWVRRALADLTLPRPVEVVSLAVGGSRVADVRRRVPEALAAEPDICVVAVGANDAIHGTPGRRFSADLDAVLTELLARVPAVAVSNVGDLGNVARVPPPLDRALRARSQVVCRRVERVIARHERAVLIDVTPSNAGFRDRSVFGADLFHPNHRGHGLWADAARSGLAALFLAVEELGLGADPGPARERGDVPTHGGPAPA